MEIWKNTQYVNYEVSNLGNVRNSKTGKILTNSLGRSNGYYKVTLSVGGKSKPIEVHRLVAVTFLGSQAGKVVHHEDEDKLNNNLSNLRWVTQSENVQLSLNSRKSRNPKFTTQQLQLIKDLYTGGMSCVQITEYCNKLWGRTTARSTYTKIAKN
ncbi:NUMOD4 motif-containing HNH endonuclease [Erwinia sp. JH02]|uniref:NUMOD4 motif-containing HNH endonuclease n=1 Tax=Erwinia sp. JH02 TaxID=2733394 RepID=UPI0014898D4B|nr:NUMOD4 motif-containing HNH endonuclease [Erwinia sp. JH02]NNS06224.1 hypothetical protein [Erwinia sp. JH02]